MSHIELLDVLSIHEYLPRVRLVEPLDQLDDGALTAPRRSYKSGCLARLKGTREALEHLKLLPRGIGEADVLEDYVSSHVIDVYLLAFLGRVYDWLMSHSVMSQFASNTTFSDCFDVRYCSAQAKRAKDRAEHDGDDCTRRVQFARLVFELLPSQQSSHVECVRIEGEDEQKEGRRRNSLLQSLLPSSRSGILEVLDVALQLSDFLSVSMDHFDGL